MMTVWFMICLAVCLFSASHSAPVHLGWCYHIPSCGDAMWPVIAEKHCNGTQQSPIDIITANVQANPNLVAFNFTAYDDQTAFTEIKNTGVTIKVKFAHKKMHVNGGDLPGTFESIQFHLHWGSGSAIPGSEHTVNGKQFPMELHIVSKLEHHNGSAVLAALGFFIEGSSDTDKPESWKTLTSYLAKVPNAGDEANITHYISMDDLLPGVDMTKYYRYNGSLTTPNCKEGVIWTIFKDPIKVSWNLIDLFSTTVYVNKATNSPLMMDTFRGVQPINGRIVTSQEAETEITASLSTSDLDVLDYYFDCPTPPSFPGFEFEIDSY